MPAISTNIKFLLGIIASIAGILAAVTGNELSKSITFFLTGKRPGRKPTKRTFRLWFVFFLSATVTVVFGSFAAFAPTAPNNFDYTLVVTTTQSSLTVTSPTLTDTPGLEQMVFVPAGEFMMGSNNDEDEKPIHPVDLDAFWMDRMEVTNGKYDECVRAGICPAPSSIRSEKREFYYGNPEFVNYLVISVTWEGANKYCAWAGKRLPKEAEWEKAARGTDGRMYPWGSDSPDTPLLNYKSEVGDTKPVDEYPEGASFYGALNMAGNVWEWVFDWYDPGYYGNSPSSNPTGPKVGDYHVLRGGSWYSPEYNIRATARERLQPGTFKTDLIGFRCAKS